MNKNIEKLRSMDMKKLVIQMSLPAVVAMLVQALYNIVDSVFVSRINEQALTAVSLAFPIQLIVIAICVGLGIGLNSFISRKLGEQDMDTAINAAEHGFFLGCILWVVLAILSMFLPRYFTSFFTDDPVITEYAVDYITIILLFSFGRIIAQVCMSILQASGNMVASMKIQLIGAITNIILDPILIFGFLFFNPMEVKGAAIATIFGQILAMVYALFLVLRSKSGLKLNLRKFHFDGSITKQVIIVGLPAMLMQGLGSVMIGGMNYILAAFSATAIAVFGAYFKLQSFILMPIFGICQGTMPIIGYNFGAKNKQRLINAIKIGMLFCVVIAFIGTLTMQLIPKQILSLFNSSEQMTQIGTSALRFLSTGLALAAISITFSNAFQALGDAHLSFYISFLRQIIVLLPVAYLLSKPLGVLGVWIAFPLSEIITLGIMFLLAYNVYNKKIKNLGEVLSE